MTVLFFDALSVHSTANAQCVFAIRDQLWRPHRQGRGFSQKWMHGEGEGSNPLWHPQWKNLYCISDTDFIVSSSKWLFCDMDFKKICRLWNTNTCPVYSVFSREYKSTPALWKYTVFIIISHVYFSYKTSSKTTTLTTRTNVYFQKTSDKFKASWVFEVTMFLNVRKVLMCGTGRLSQLSWLSGTVI